MAWVRRLTFSGLGGQALDALFQLLKDDDFKFDEVRSR